MAAPLGRTFIVSRDPGPPRIAIVVVVISAGRQPVARDGPLAPTSFGAIEVRRDVIGARLQPIER